MNQRIRHSILLLDLLWIATAFTVAYTVRYPRPLSGVASISDFREFVPEMGFALLIWTILYFSKNLDGFRGGWHFPTVFSQIAVAVFYLMSFLLALAFMQKHYFSRLLLFYLACLLPIGFIGIRCVARWVISSRSWTSATRRVVILGSGDLAHEVAYKIFRHPELLLEVVGLLYPSRSGSSDSFSAHQDKLVTLQSLDVDRILLQKEVKELIVVMPQLAGPGAEQVISKCREAGMRISIVPDWYQLYISHAQMIEVDGLPIISLEERSISVAALGFKRIVDLIGGLFLLALSVPILLVSAVSLNRRYGKAYRKETRCGRMGIAFPMFRLNIDRENPSPIGIERLLIRLSLTELPQLLNVLRGEMSLVGPRPESPDRARHYSDWQRQRLSVKPGLTGLAQVHGLRDQHSSEEKARFDLEYIFHWSIFLDFSLILQTAWTIAVRLINSPVGKWARGAEGSRSIQISAKEVSHVDRTESSAD